MDRELERKQDEEAHGAEYFFFSMEKKKEEKHARRTSLLLQTKPASDGFFRFCLTLELSKATAILFLGLGFLSSLSSHTDTITPVADS